MLANIEAPTKLSPEAQYVLYQVLRKDVPTDEEAACKFVSALFYQLALELDLTLQEIHAISERFLADVKELKRLRAEKARKNM